MKLRMIAAPLATLAIGIALAAAPMTASANGYHRDSDRGNRSRVTVEIPAVTYCAPVQDYTVYPVAREGWRRPVVVRRDDFRRDRDRR